MVTVKVQKLPGNWLKQFSDIWRNFRASPKIYHLVKYGYKIKFLKGSKPPVSTPDWKKATKLLKSQMKVIRKEVADLCVKGAVRRIDVDEANSTLGYYSHMFCVPKPGNKKRAIINLKPFNVYVSKKSFKMETIKDVKNIIRPGMWGATIDLSDAYYHIGIHRLVFE